MPDSIHRLLRIMAKLRDPQDGCEWDRAQTFSTIAPYTIEEAYEVADAIERNDMRDLKEELGDLLLQVVFHSQMADEGGHFDFSAVASTISDKMEARHPYIFSSYQNPDDQNATGQDSRWESLKALERSAKGATSAMDGVATALPALLRAEKLQKRAAREGFDWPDPEGPAEKLAEEARELKEASPADRFEEAGDLLFAAVNLVRAYGISPEEALRAGNAKFERRYRGMESIAGCSLSSLSLDDQEALWQEVKQSERGEPS
ncbi:nucleoside triphosphate pyrophosphohydrolase [Croceicoccus estronivorus]|uniref:nucleoside triphosphate pyrophosphohydrolase n=1 Tax=Croceicoccus estronivorus TaxID=1172626 RepID=UPI000831927A|nr:nucleoside triphosphate pyrophosphohydrolase [Croceicoccus estronivorus]OCC24523.1 nucleoside triphosphate pyrophosphohydrolase [Croceicoccus estronivorus]